VSFSHDELSELLAPHGLIPRGALRLEGSEALSLNAKSLILIGHAGSSIWPHFQKWRSAQPHNFANPLDTWSEQVISPIAAALGGRAVFPFQKPFHPFQQWAMRAQGLRPSPLGILIHPVYGLWHAYRGAIAFEAESLIQEAQETSHPCDLCAGKPCLSACPVNAFSKDGYDVSACRTHLASREGNACISGGCLARLACPVGSEFKYSVAQMQFHMHAFAA
jgi:ferredoxin